jgi:hypothetical protein
LNPFQELLSAEVVRNELAEVLTRPELRERESLLERFIRWLQPHLETKEVEAFGDALLAVLSVGLLLALFVLLRRAFRAYRSEELSTADEARSTAERADARVRELAARARQARADGDLRLAVRSYLEALLLALSGRGDFELRPSWTNRELLARGKLVRAVRELLEPLVRELEPKEFGRAHIEARDLERLEVLLAPYLERRREAV